jgi:ribosomal-protein-alanine N-acetyltransferase
LGRVCEIEKLCFRYPWSRQSFEEVLASPVFGTIAARDRWDRVVGYVIFSEVADELHVLNVAIHPSCRRLGLATTLLVSLHKMALRRGRAFAYLEVRESNKVAQQLYSKFGYKPLTKRKEYYADNREDAIMMTVPLKKTLFP